MLLRHYRQAADRDAATPDAGRLSEFAGMAARGEIRPVIDRSYALPDAAAAIRHLEGEHARGKIVVTT